MADITLLPSAKVPLIYEGDNTMTTEWYRFFWNIYGFTGTGVVPVDKGGTGLSTIGNHQVIIGNTNNVFEPAVFTGSGINISYSTGVVNFAIGASGIVPGTYGSASQVGVFTVNQYGILTAASNTSIGIDANQIISGTIASARILGSYTGITGVGTLTAGTWSATTIDTAYGGTGLTSFTSGGALYATSTTALTSGTLPVASGGTGQTSYTNGQLLIGNTTGNTLTKATLTAGSGVTITNGTGSITISATGSGGTVTSVSGTLPISVATGTTTPVISISQANTTTNGYLSSTDWNTFNSKANAFTYTNKYVPYGQGTTTPNQSSSLQFDGTTLGVGGTLSAWSGAGSILQILGGAVWGSASVLHSSLNTYFDGSVYKYIASNFATDHYQLNGTFVWRNTTSGTAGNTITWTTGMTLDASNNLSITGTATANGVLLTGNTGTVTSVAALTLGTTGTDLSSTVANSTTTPVITLNVPTASATNRGALSAADWSTFNGKADTFTYTTNYIPYGQGTTTPTQSAGLQYNGTTLTVGGPITNNGLATLGATTGGLQILGKDVTYSGSNNYFATQGDAVQRIRIGHYDSGTVAFPTGLVPAQILAGGVNLELATRDIATGNIIFRTGSGVTEKARIPAAGGIQSATTISVGNATPSASGAGVTFPATQSASTNANTLDDYEEGTFTPTVVSTSGTITTVGATTGQYTKIGDLVTVIVFLPITTNGTGAGSIRVTNMPFTCNATASSYGAGREQNLTGNGLFGYINTGTTSLYIQKYDGTYPGGTGYGIGFTITYKV